MLVPLSIEDSRKLLAFFQNAGYSEVNIKKQLRPAELPSRRLRNEARLMDRTAEPTLLNTLLRWFWIGLALDKSQVADIVPEEMLRLMTDCGLLELADGILTAKAMLVPTVDFLVAADHPKAIERGESEMVLWPNPTSKFLANFSIRRHSGATLDLGTGSGILSLGASKFSDTVVGTDLNPRASSFVQFNARLNGIENIEALTGDRFAPVKDRRFDLILTNPPFFITPRQGYLFCENELELDELCRRIVKEAPAYLNEGGYLEMLCEWAQVAGQPWEERIAEWVRGIGCDAWVMKGMTQDPAEYAQRRIAEITENPGDDARLFDGYMAYYRELQVEAIHDGVIVLRKRDGDNWIRIEEVPKTASGDMGETILATFAARDILLKLQDDAALLAARPRLSEFARLEQVCMPSNGCWAAESINLRLTRGFPFQLKVQPLVADFLATCDGNRTAEEAIRAFAAVANAPVEIVQRESLAMMRTLIDRGYMVIREP